MSGVNKKTVGGVVKASGERRATAIGIRDFTIPDLDRDGYATTAFTGSPPALPMYRDHEWRGGGGNPPFGVATWHVDNHQLRFDIEYLPTPRGDEEYATHKALAAKGVKQAVSIGFRIIETGPVPEVLRAKGAERFITKAELLELSVVLVGAVPGAQLTGVKGTKQPDPSELAGVIAESERIFREGAKLLARTEPTPEQQAAQIKAGLSALQEQVGPWLPSEVSVDPDLHRGTVAHVARAAGVLGIKPPAVKWFSRHSVQGEKYGGLYSEYDYSIYLRDDLRGFELAKIANHECLHANRGARGMPQDEAAVRLETERLATLYAREVLYGSAAY